MPKPWTIVVDLALIVVFAVIGRASHHEGLTVGGVLETAWPFLVAGFLGGVLGWLLFRVSWAVSGVVATVVTVIGGMIFRVATGGSWAFAFLVVAMVTLAILLIGWRLLFHLAWTRRAR